jgi:hypothetical protein
LFSVFIDLIRFCRNSADESTINEISFQKMATATNPFSGNDTDRAAIWEMLVKRDITAFLAADWAMVADDFITDGFMGIDGKKLANPDDWRISFPTLLAYRTEWLRQAAATQAMKFAEDPRRAIFRATSLKQIEISGDRAVVHKKFDGAIAKADGGSERLLWQTLYFCRRHEGRWKISGFVGYLPNPMGGA